MESKIIRTREEVLSDFHRKGISVASWAKEHGFNRGTVLGVLSGRLSGRIGVAHKISVMLGLKDGEIIESTEKQEHKG